MDNALTKYKAVVAAQPLLDDGWFGQALAQSRQGDDEARRRILGSGLRLALDIAETMAPEQTEIPFWDLVQEANGALTRSLDQFAGSLADDFTAHADHNIRSHLRALSA